MKRPANDDKERVKKRTKLSSTSSSQATRKFTNAESIRATFRAQNPDVLAQGLANLRNQLTIKHNEEPISSQDERLLLVQQWLGDGRGVQEIFDIWEKTNSKDATLNALIISLLSAILSLTSLHYTYHTIGHPILKTLLTPTWIRRLNSYIGGLNNELILVSLKLYNSSSTFAGGRERKAVLDAFPWELKSLPKLLNMRRKGKSPEADPFIRPDIRTLYFSFLLSFIHEDSSSHIKTSFLERHRDAFLAIFKGLSQDQYPLIKKILEVCWTGLWSDPKVKRTLKLGIFSEVTIGHLMKLYDRDRPEDEDPSCVPADLVHHFLLGICSRPGFGICFKDSGWYPREQDATEKVTNDDSDFPSQKGSKIYNKILFNVLKTLKVNEDPRQQELALKIMAACPELVASYWPAAALTLEPRLSSKWLANIAFFGSVISLPIPSSSFFLAEDSRTGAYQPTPPPLHAILENILPSVNTKLNFTKGLQSPSGLVQHCTALALTKCLIKYDQVLQTFRRVAAELEEDVEEGQWFRRIRDLEREVRRRVPEFQVIVAFSQHDAAAAAVARPQGTDHQSTRTALLAESALRLLWMYHRCLPVLVAETRFDVGKLLQRFYKASSNEGDEGEDEEEEEEAPDSDAVERLDRVRRLHVLRLLKESDQFTWTGKLSGSSSHSYFRVLLKSFASAEITAERNALDELLRHILSQTILFQEDTDEPSLWLSALPTTRRSTGSVSPDGALLTDEAESVISFLDDSVQRCTKTPYRYLEELQVLIKDADVAISNDNMSVYPSPLLITIVEQLNAKIGAKLLSPSDVLSLASFVRKLIVNLAMKVSDLSLLQSLCSKIDGILSEDRLFSEYPALTAAVRREVRILKSCLSRLARDDSEQIHDSVSVSGEVADFLREVAQLSPPSSSIARANGAYELVDWVRLVGEPIGPDEVNCIVDVVKDFYPLAISAVIGNLDPAEQSIWEAIDVEYTMQYPGFISFQHLYLHADRSALLDEEPRSIITRVLMDSPTLLDIKRAVQLISHGSKSTASEDELCCAVVLLLTKIMEGASDVLSVNDMDTLKEQIFAQDRNLKSLFVMQDIADSTRDALKELVRGSLDPTTERDKIVISDVCTYWLNVIKDVGLSDTKIQTAAIWIDYFPISELLKLVDDLGRSVEEIPSPTSIFLLNCVLSALQRNCTNNIDLAVDLRKRLPLLFVLLDILQDCAALDDLIAAAIGDSLSLYSPFLPLLDSVSDSTPLSTIIRLSEGRRCHIRKCLPDSKVVQHFLGRDTWTKSTVKILCAFAYERAISQGTFVSWLKTDKCQKRSLDEYLPVLASILDKMHADREEIVDSQIETFIGLFRPLVQIVLDGNATPQYRSIAARCAMLIIELIPAKLATLIAQLSDLVESSDIRALTPDILSLALNIHQKASAAAKHLVTSLVERGMQYVVRRLSDDEHPSGILKRLFCLVKIAKDVKGQYLETLLGVVIQNHLRDRELVGLVSSALSSTHLKPVVVNRHLQSILQHPQFVRLCAVSGDNETRDAIVDLLFTLFNLHPSNTCQVTHVEPLIGIYRATLSPSDMKLYSIFRLFEAERKLSVAPLFSRWSTNPSAPSSNFLEALQSLDPNIVIRACLRFPKWRKLEEDHSKTLVDNHDAQLYDPVFLILMFGNMLSVNPPSSAIAWVEMFRTNIVSLLVRSLSSKDARIREIALCHLAALWKSLQTVDLQEKSHVLYILGLLKDTYTQPSDDQPQRLPSYSTLLISHALRGVFYPSNFIYPLTSRFLLQRPELDIRDVPMLYGMLYSSSDDWKKERGWIIRMLADGAMSSDDWRVLKSRHTWDLLASLFQTSDADHTLQKGILEVLANLTCNTLAATSLILKSSLLTWIQMQLHVPSDREDVAWAKILANIVFLSDAEKMESATHGEWRKIICRCLSILLEPSRCTDTLALLSVISPTVLKLSSLPCPPVFIELEKVLDNAVERLTIVEAKIDILPISQEDLLQKSFTLPPHSASGLHDMQEQDSPLSTWGRSVEMLWQVAMGFDIKPRSWDALTVRVLTWRHIVDADQSSVGEWARISVLQSINSIQ